MLVVSCYYIFLDKTPRGNDDGENMSPSWCSSIYCD